MAKISIIEVSTQFWALQGQRLEIPKFRSLISSSAIFLEACISRSIFQLKNGASSLGSSWPIKHLIVILTPSQRTGWVQRELNANSILLFEGRYSLELYL